ncbi:hypothetical protein N7517_008242 [Penicillium concentricum]|uniref:Uncharacterized protein n=1 Tax=Penicillium concentricum TaxID=293559 RepID=A0A9W9RS49_9EURO|nr:uncharacterized protein N7517_008242 [Penicillium concentricum]KAJ5365356.1 hypothetical protein N7517_008242 [Penicillium concentricum]
MDLLSSPCIKTLHDAPSIVNLPLWSPSSMTTVHLDHINLGPSTIDLPLWSPSIMTQINLGLPTWTFHHDH